MRDMQEEIGGVDTRSSLTDINDAFEIQTAKLKQKELRFKKAKKKMMKSKLKEYNAIHEQNNQALLADELNDKLSLSHRNRDPLEDFFADDAPIVQIGTPINKPVEKKRTTKRVKGGNKSAAALARKTRVK